MTKSRRYKELVFKGILVIIIGFFTGLVGFFIFFAFGPMFRPAGPIISTVIVLLALAWFIYIFTEGENRRNTVIITILIIVSASYTSCFMVDFIIGKADWKYPFYHPTGISGSLANEEEWNLPQPRCATSSYTRGNESLKAGAFYYKQFLTYNPYHSIPQSLYKKITCGIALSRTAYQEYKERLDNQGFEIEENTPSSSFTATNNTLVVYCYLDGKHVVVAKASKDEKHLLKPIMEIN